MGIMLRVIVLIGWILVAAASALAQSFDYPLQLGSQ
jgi:hypothetical protein